MRLLTPPPLSLALLLLSVSACFGSEVGNPPFEPGSAESPFVADQIRLDVDPAGIGPFIVRIPRSVLVGAREVQMTILSGTATSIPLELREDQWQTPALVGTGDVLRFSARDDDDWYTQADFLVEGDTLVAVPAPRCLEWERRALSPGDAARVRNGCSEPIELRASMRRGLWGVTPVSRSLQPGEVATFELSSVEDEDTLFIEERDEGVAFMLRP